MCTRRSFLPSFERLGTKLPAYILRYIRTLTFWRATWTCRQPVRHTHFSSACAHVDVYYTRSGASFARPLLVCAWKSIIVNSNWASIQIRVNLNLIHRYLRKLWDWLHVSCKIHVYAHAHILFAQVADLIKCPKKSQSRSLSLSLDSQRQEAKLRIYYLRDDRTSNTFSWLKLLR